MSDARRAALALALVVPAPSVGVIAGLWVAPGPVGQAVYAICKLWMIALPLIWWLRVDGEKISWSPMKRGGLGFGALTGVAIGALILAFYFAMGDRLIDPQLMRDAAAKNGLDRKAVYLGLTVQLSLINALVEEYVWRWFVYTKCAVLMRTTTAVVATALFFSIHHFLALLPQFGMPIAILGSLGTFVGSVIWSWCYRRYGSIWPAYLSHVIIDVSVFAVGWLVLFAG